MGVKVAFLPDCSLVLSLLKYRGVGVFLNQKKMRNSNRRSPLNNMDEFINSAKLPLSKINQKDINFPCL